LRELEKKASEGSSVRGFKGPRVQGFEGSRVQGFESSRVREFESSMFQGSKNIRSTGFIEIVIEIVIVFENNTLKSLGRNPGS